MLIPPVSDRLLRFVIGRNWLGQKSFIFLTAVGGGSFVRRGAGGGEGRTARAYLLTLV